jgi:general stress protein CsbA
LVFSCMLVQLFAVVRLNGLNGIVTANAPYKYEYSGVHPSALISSN